MGQQKLVVNTPSVQYDYALLFPHNSGGIEHLVITVVDNKCKMKSNVIKVPALPNSLPKGTVHYQCYLHTIGNEAESSLLHSFSLY